VEFMHHLQSIFFGQRSLITSRTTLGLNGCHGAVLIMKDGCMIFLYDGLGRGKDYPWKCQGIEVLISRLLLGATSRDFLGRNSFLMCSEWCRCGFMLFYRTV
jgi:hypothetical protein